MIEVEPNTSTALEVPHVNTQTIWVPSDVLNRTTHSASTRLIWLFLSPPSTRAQSALTDLRLHKLSGLDRKTIGAARATLARAPLATCHRRPHPSCAAMPVAS